jgi:hypothetical protein
MESAMTKRLVCRTRAKRDSRWGLRIPLRSMEFRERPLCVEVKGPAPWLRL